MSWFFEGTGLNITMGTTRAGTLRISGDGTQDCRPSAGDFNVLGLAAGLEGLFTINSAEATPFEYDVAGHGLKDFVDAKPHEPAVMIVYHSAASGLKAAIGADIVVPAAHMASMFAMAKLLIGRPDLRYVLTLEFFGLPEEGFSTDAPTLKQFSAKALLDRRPYFGREVTFNVLPAHRNK